MEKTNVPYEAWPEWIKTLTAFYSKRFIIKDPNFIIGLSAINITLGILILYGTIYYTDTLEDTPLESKVDFPLTFLAVLNVTIGLFNLLFTYKYYSWILRNSSWDERFLVKSNGKHQLRYFLIYFNLIMISIGITYFICS